MFNTVYVGSAVDSLEAPEQLNGYSKVILQVSEDVQYEAGTNGGRVLTLSCPWGTPQMAQNILASIRGYQYQPFEASGAVLNPAAEPGDAVQIRGVHGGIYNVSATFGRTFRADISAPGEEEIDESVPYKSTQERQINRRFGQVESQFKIQAGLIEARVARTGGDDSSFGWKMLETSQTWYANGAEILRLDASGADLKGKITALAGKIGGFDIQKDYLSYNGQTWGGTNSWGGYWGINGIQMGRNFKVDMAGNLEAASGRFTGEVYAGRINYGGDAGYFDGSGLSGHSVTGNEIGYSTIGTPNVNSGVKVPLGYANFSNDVFNGVTMAPTAKVGSITFKDNKKYAPGTLYYKAWDGSNKSVRIIMEL